MGLNRRIPTDEVMEQIVDLVIESPSKSISIQELRNSLGRRIYIARLRAGLEMAKGRKILVAKRIHGEWRWYLTPETETMAERVPEVWKVIGRTLSESDHIPRMYIMRLVKAGVLSHRVTEMFPRTNILYFGPRLSEQGDEYVVRNGSKYNRYYRHRPDRKRVV